MTCFTVEDANVGLHGNELVYRNGALIGYLVRAGNSYSGETREGIGFCYVKVDTVNVMQFAKTKMVS